MSRLELRNVEDVIEQEIGDGFTQRKVASTYALALASSFPIDWHRINAAIMQRWSRPGLAAVKRRAWKLHEARR